MLCSPQLQLSMTASHISRQGHARLIACRHTAQTGPHRVSHASCQDTVQSRKSYSVDWSTQSVSCQLSRHSEAGNSSTL